MFLLLSLPELDSSFCLHGKGRNRVINSAEIGMLNRPSLVLLSGGGPIFFPRPPGSEMAAVLVQYLQYKNFVGVVGYGVLQEPGANDNQPKN